MNEYKIATPAHQKAHDRVLEILNRLKNKGGLPGVRLKLSPPRSQPSGPVAWITSVHFDASGGESFPGNLALYCMRASGKVEVRLEPRPQSNGERALVPPALMSLLRPLEALFQKEFEGLVDPQFKPQESLAQRRARERQEAEAEFDDMLAIFGGAQ